MATQSQTKPAAPQLIAANHYELSNGSLSITYSSTDLLGRPRLSYQDGKQTRNYVGDQIRFEQTALGQLVSVADADPALVHLSLYVDKPVGSAQLFVNVRFLQEPLYEIAEGRHSCAERKHD